MLRPEPAKVVAPVLAAPITMPGLKALFFDAPVAIAILDAGGAVIDANIALAELLGVQRTDLIDHPLTERIAEDGRKGVQRALARLLRGDERHARFPGVRVLTPGQSNCSVALDLLRLEPGGESQAGAVAYLRTGADGWYLDIEHAQAQKMQALGQLAGGVAHDFNNLLTAILGFSDLLLVRHPPGDASFEDIAELRQNALRASKLVQQLLAFSRKQPVQPVVLDVNQALISLANMLGRVLGATVELHLDLEADEGLVLVDPVQFDQVIINLAVNARDAMEGGGRLTIETADEVVHRSVRRGREMLPRGSYVVIRVRDTGPGIPADVIDRVFEPFFSTKEVGRGTGLGLSTVYGIVRQTGGFVCVDSEAGEGATFTLYLPAHDAAARAVPEADEREAGVLPPATGDTAGCGTVLLVEDEGAVRAFAARALRGRGYDVLEACDGERALEVIGAGRMPIDVIVSDVVMPGMDGYALVREARRRLPGIKVVLMSGYANEASGADIRSDSSVRFLAKPFSLAALATTLKEATGG